MFFYFLLVQQLVAESICWRQFFISWLLVLCEERSPNLSSTQTSQHHIKMNLLFYFVIYIISWCYNFVYITSWCILYTVITCGSHKSRKIIIDKINWILRHKSITGFTRFYDQLITKYQSHPVNWHVTTLSVWWRPTGDSYDSEKKNDMNNIILFYIKYVN